MEIMVFFLTFGIALIGSYAAKKCRIPAGAMTGAILSVALLNCLTGKAAVPLYTKPCMQVLGGALLGHRISRNDVKKLSGMIRAAAVLVTALLLLNLTIGLIVYWQTDMNLPTAILSTAPGGVSDMALIAEEFGADMGTVSIMQLFRMFGIYLVFPPVLRLTQKEQKHPAEESAKSRIRHKTQAKRRNTVDCLYTLAAAFSGGFLFDKAGLPAGFMVGSVVLCAGLNIAKGCGYIPGNWRFFIQSVTGAIIGCQMTRDNFFLLGELIVPIMILIAGMLVFTFLFGRIMANTSELDFQTSLLCLTPGGIQETSLLADELGCDTTSVVVMHTIRLVVVICIFPALLSLLMQVIP